MRVKRKSDYQAIEPDEILVDAANLPSFDTGRLEGRLEQPIAPLTFRRFLFFLGLAGAVALLQLINLQVREYPTLAARAEANRLNNALVIAERGLILDRSGVPLAKNAIDTSATTSDASTAEREYPLGAAAAHLVGYVTYPKKDPNGYWYQDAIEGVSGAERIFDYRLKGANGLRISETDATGEVVSGMVAREARTGSDILLSIDAGLQKEFFDALAVRSRESKWKGGAGAVMDLRSGELIALASYPSFDPDVMSSGEPSEEVAAFLSDPSAPLLDRAVSGLYTPGSTVKPFVAAAALTEGVIDPMKKILSTGSISVPNPYDPEHPSVFKDWKAHGWVDMRDALAVSSDVYFYEVGGGFEDQRGLGIAKIEAYFKKFGFGETTGSSLLGEEAGVIPNPEWKAEHFGGEPWYLGNTYHTAIGQYGVQATVLELVRAVAAIGNGGTLVTPVLEAGNAGERSAVGIPEEYIAIVREGMRQAVTHGTAQALSLPGLAVAAKTGTAEVGVKKEFVNSVVIGFFPYENPRYAFALVMERAPAGTALGAPAAMRTVLEWVSANRPEFFE